MAIRPSKASWLPAILCGGLIGCGAAGGNGAAAPTSVTLTLSPQPTSIPVNSTVTFTTKVSSGINSPNWALDASAYANLGTPNGQIGGSTFVYTAPPTPPDYMGAGQYTTPGTVTLEASQYDGTAFATFTITAPSITVGASPAISAVALGATEQLSGYAIGSLNNALTAEVNGVVGGSPSTGTIAVIPGYFYGYYTYTAPAIMPITGNQVTVTFVSQADSTKTASAMVTLIKGP